MLLAIAAPAQSLFATPDWVTVGLVLSIVGSFFLANAILFRHPRSLVREHFGAYDGRLRSIREYIFHRVQIHLGFLFLLSGFGLQLYGRLRPAPVDPDAGFPVAWVGAILILAVGLELLGWWLSHRLFRGYVREYFIEHPVDFDQDIKLAREIGALFGIESSGEDTVQSYVARLCRDVGLPRHGRPETRSSSGTVQVVEEELA